MIYAKLAFMISLALFVGVSNCTRRGSRRSHLRRRTLSESIMRAFHDIGYEHIVSTELMIAKVEEGKNNDTSTTTDSHRHDANGRAVVQIDG